MKKRKTFFAHDENCDCNDGDLVMIEECPKISKQKYFKLVEILERSQSYTDPDTGIISHQPIK